MLEKSLEIDHVQVKVWRISYALGPRPSNLWNSQTLRLGKWTGKYLDIYIKALKLSKTTLTAIPATFKPVSLVYHCILWYTFLKFVSSFVSLLRSAILTTNSANLFPVLHLRVPECTELFLQTQYDCQAGRENNTGLISGWIWLGVSIIRLTIRFRG